VCERERETERERELVIRRIEKVLTSLNEIAFSFSSYIFYGAQCDQMFQKIGPTFGKSSQKRPKYLHYPLSPKLPQKMLK
jgi:hypothetical protein